ncbi:hypothetical protein MRS44_009677 [Fusarium solani]|uniref:uncharacterized protein n=1 Tax=Fusarium solani TaxID=169388 RepID=UPI0032C48062|nr:hypothetical protein MRS44_009677 [Fusarium solani]
MVLKSLISVLRNSSIFIKDSVIVSIGKPLSPSDTATAEVIDVSGKIISPGFSDTHHHLWQSAYKTIISNTSLSEYLVRYGEFSSARQHFKPEDIYLGTLIGVYEALNAGVTSILDHAHHTWSKEQSVAGLRGAVDSRARVWWAYGIHDLEDEFTLDDQFEDLGRLARDEETIWSGSRASVGIAYDRFCLAGKEEIEKTLNLVRDLNLSIITTHFVGDRMGLPNSPTLLNSFSALNATIPIVFSHGRSVNPDDAVLLRRYNHFLGVSSESAHHYGQDHPEAHHVQDHIALGIDTHTTYSTDIVTQARLWLQVTRLRLYRLVTDNWKMPTNNPMSVNQAFILATYNGARAFHRKDLGIIAPGAKADIVVFRGDSPNLFGWRDPVAAVILHSNVGDVEHVLIDGEFVKRDGKLVGSDIENVKQRFLESATRIQEIYEEMPPVILEGEYAPGVPYQATEIVDVVQGYGTGY